MTETEPRRRSTDFDKPRPSAIEWLRLNFVLLTGAITILGLLITAVLWYASTTALGVRFSELAPQVLILAKDIAKAEDRIRQLQDDMKSADQRLNELRKRIEEDEKTAADVRRVIDLGIARLDERAKSLETHSPPLPFTPPPRPR